MDARITDIDSLKQFIRDRTRKTWDERKIPYYLSYVATDLAKLDVDYRDYTGALKLSQWASSTEFPDTKFVAHSIQKAKMGFVPADVDFSFENTVSLSGRNSRTAAPRRDGRALQKFVECLADLPEELLADFQVPARILIALSKN